MTPILKHDILAQLIGLSDEVLFGICIDISEKGLCRRHSKNHLCAQVSKSLAKHKPFTSQNL